LRLKFGDLFLAQMQPRKASGVTDIEFSTHQGRK
jgi:hypothetical protein